MYLVQLYDKDPFNIFVDNQLGECMFHLSMRVTKTNLLVIVLVKADRCTVEKLYKVFKADPEYAVPVVIYSQLCMYLFHVA